MSAKKDKIDKKDKKVSIQEPPPRPKANPDSLSSPPPAVSTRLSVIAPPKFVSLLNYTTRCLVCPTDTCPIMRY